jgi:ubiquitin
MSAISPPQSSNRNTPTCATHRDRLNKTRNTQKTVHENNEPNVHNREHKKSLTCKSCKNAKKFSDEISKDAKKYEETQLRVFQYTDDDDKKILKKMEKCNKCKTNPPHKKM